ncbi:hypothetical protein M9H77_33093 [Catharanthus roseus]|uniref:Uncharacterized protein n=1 Tax=Catharanthus roseus TaxID=4058 RepID=A0ACB9ZHZ9_CATRO|nr:hypothetical protein M9H77_33093 [Catharanthus roseus]
MKIFNWVHRRFTHKGGFNENVKKEDEEESCIFTKDIEAQALLANIVVTHDLMLDVGSWKGGLLSIGTLGGLGDFTHVQVQVQHPNYHAKEKEEALMEVEDAEYYSAQCDLEYDNDEKEEGEEMNPLLIEGGGGSNSNRRHYEIVSPPPPPPPAPTRARAPAAAAAAAAAAASVLLTIDATPLSLAGGDDRDRSKKWDHSISTTKKERVTLADLFSAESDHDHEARITKVSKINRKVPAGDFICKKTGPHHHSSKKLMISGKFKDDSARPMKKLGQMMKRMMKRKIHPDAAQTKHIIKDDRLTESSSPSSSNNESISLLHQIQDVVGVSKKAAN